MNLSGFTTAELQSLRQRLDTIRIMAASDHLAGRLIREVTLAIDNEIVRRSAAAA